eukprot:CAMPEP_0194361474 /NCGR_PEP_ID=MMETSP0174-20130528/9057_1 /TAXON_ID=216777 /ORGANISM="Proboscia alata, Strain PI-D3" /LENGTH=3162 /DNA_ID=CAMNT_0039133703 /DNA_START=62 /DNA_END=9550 /DNA_ORIENTATION=-
MSDEDGEGETSEVRWTCEACGCHRNTETRDSLSCGVCGTRRVTSLLLRRGIIRRSQQSSSRRRDNEGEGDSEDDSENSDSDSEENDNEPPSNRDNVSSNEMESISSAAASLSSPLALLAAESGGVRRSQRTADQHASSLSSAAADLLSTAKQNAPHFQPSWSSTHKGSSVKIFSPIPLSTGSSIHIAENSVALLKEPSRLQTSGLISDRTNNNGDGNKSLRRSSHQEGSKISAARSEQSLPSPECSRRQLRINQGIRGRSSSSSDKNGSQQPVYGWKIAFDYLGNSSKGAGLGGSCLIGITTKSFQVNVDPTLHQSKLFWGIEDGGRKYEGNISKRYHQSSNAAFLSRSEMLLSRYHHPNTANENTRVASECSSGALFNGGEAISIVVDLLESSAGRSMYFFRNDGSLICTIGKLPKGLKFYPVVAISSQREVCVAITSLDCDPLSVLNEFQHSEKIIREKKYHDKRNALVRQKEKILTVRTVNGKKTFYLSTNLKKTLTKICKWYALDESFTCFSGGAFNEPMFTTIDDAELKDLVQLKVGPAARLWHRCGLSISGLRRLFESSFDSKHLMGEFNEAQMSCSRNGQSFRLQNSYVTSDDFIDCVLKIVREEESKYIATPCPAHESVSDLPGLPFDPIKSEKGEQECDGSIPSEVFEVGDKVELTDEYDMFGDALSGPLRSGDCGTVLEVQRSTGSRGAERSSIRVLFNGRRWWYQPHALLSEKSGLIECPSVRFVVSVLRAHGFDSSMKSLWGKSPNKNSWKLGDLVISATNIDGSPRNEEISDLKLNASLAHIGRIAADTASSTRKYPDAISVNFFAGASKQMNLSKLLFTTCFHGSSVLSMLKNQYHKDLSTVASPVFQSDCISYDDEAAALQDDESDGNADMCFGVKNADINSKIAGLAQLDESCIGQVSKECDTSLGLARLFAAGLKDAMLSAILRVTNDDVKTSVVKQLVNLFGSITHQLFSVEGGKSCVVTNSHEELSVSLSSDSNRSSLEERWIGRSENSLSNVNEHAEQRVRSLNGADSRENFANARQLQVIRDLGRGSEQRRSGVFLALMASEVGTDNNLQRNRLLSSFERLSAEAAAFANPSSNPSPSSNSTYATFSRPITGHPLASSRIGSRANTVSGLRLNSSRRSNSLRHSIDASTSSLVNDGLLLNNLLVVKAALKSGADVKYRDEEDNTVLSMAVHFGCGIPIIECLIKVGGASICVAEIGEAATSDQKDILELLLEHTVYLEGSVDTSKCTDIIVETLAKAVSKQNIQEKEMFESSESFGCELLNAFSEMILTFQLKKKTSEAYLCAELLVGDVLLHAVHESQHQEHQNSSSHESSANDGRVPAFVSSARSTKSDYVDEVLKNKSTHKSKSLLNIFPARAFCSKLTGDIVDSVGSPFLRLVESYLWSTAMKDAAIGLTLTLNLLQKEPSLRTQIIRYGLKDLCATHAKLAEEALCFIAKRNEYRPESGVRNGLKISCPKGHTTMLHLTRHAHFRCDICGKGVEQDKPMHGCRECDWDACESCTDHCEGGVVKWKKIREISLSCLERLSSLHRKKEKAFTIISNVGNEDIHRLSRAIRRRDPSSIKELGFFFKLRKITLHEFSMYILPSLHSALLCEEDRCFENGIGSYPTKRRIKKARVGGDPKILSNRHHTKCSGRNLKQGDKQSFLDSLVEHILSLRASERLPSNVRSSDASINGLSEDPVLSSAGHNDMDMDGSNYEDSEVQHKIAEKKEASPQPAPEIIRHIQTILAFRESVAVTSNKPNPFYKGSDLQSLLLPFEIKLYRCADSMNAVNDRPSSGLPYGYCDNQMANLPDTCQNFEIRVPPSMSCSDLNGASIHVEPLMPLPELQLHILRCCIIKIPAYLQFCRSLVVDHAIIWERPINSASLSNGSGPCAAKREKKRIARVISFDENLGAHTVRYASRMISRNESTCDSEGDLFRLEKEINIASQLEFNGKEATIILASRDYCVLHRDQNSDNAFVMDRNNIDESVILPGECLDYTEPTSSKCSEPFQLLADESKKDSITSLLLPIGTRVESNFKCNVWEVYTIISASIEADDFTSFFDEDIQALPSSVSSHDKVGSNGDQQNPSDIMLGRFCRYVLCSDSGEVVLSVPGSSIRGHDIFLNQKRKATSENSMLRDQKSNPHFLNNSSIFERSASLANARRILSSANSISDPGPSCEAPKTPTVGVLRRTWSALSPLQNMCSLDLNRCCSEDRPPEGNLGRTRKMSVGENDDIDIDVDVSRAELPPNLTVEFSSTDSMSPINVLSTGEITLFNALQRLSSKNSGSPHSSSCLDKKCRIFYSVIMHRVNEKVFDKSSNAFINALPFSPPWMKCRLDISNSQPTSLRDDFIAENDIDISMGTPSDFVNSNDAFALNSSSSTFARRDGIDLSLTLENCDGLDETCAKCLQLLNILVEHCAVSSLIKESTIAMSKNERIKPTTHNMVSNEDSISCMFVSESLTGKLLEQLEDPLSVVGGALPDWCSVAPTFSPRVFSHLSRRRLLECAAFGVSRSAFCQQEAKVAVAHLRQRMAALRGRAVELVGEAFSGGADDPTALQLQADELYGMEEALAAKVNAAFRSQRWDERSLQCAKAAVQRSNLLEDAARLMENYATDASVNRRRLEVRFAGESGFDAASGDEAGVTRGFYADVAEKLLSCEHVAGVRVSSHCTIEGIEISGDHLLDDRDSLSGAKQRLPLWIPDFDLSGKVVIPTPRANPMSTIGVYPRPLGPNHPQLLAVMKQFRLMGRLFAAAMRDGFVYPLPLSTSFLKLAQYGKKALYYDVRLANKFRHHSMESSGSSMASDDLSNNSMMPSSTESYALQMSLDDGCDNSNSTFSNASPANIWPQTNFSIENFGILTTDDLPRPGFLGGEIYAVEQHICAILDKLEESEPNLSEAKYMEQLEAIATDKSFARKALGKKYECSFEDYFEGKTFVDPLDPMQDEDAYPLLPGGGKKCVTIENIRDWVILAKRFFLYDGVISQAIAFRQGINDFFSADALLLFTPKELQRDICGGGDNVENWDENAIRGLFKLDGKGTAEALVAVAAMGGEGGAALSRRFGPSSPTLSYLVKSLLDGSTTQRRQFLSFVTSIPITTPGQIEVVPVVNPAGEFLPMSDPSCLPRANTCARRLYLPKFENYESFFKVFWAVVREESRFKGFYEWRG